MIDFHYASLTSQGVQHREIIQMVTHPDIKPVQQGLTSANDRKRCFPLVIAMPYSTGFLFMQSVLLLLWTQQCDFHSSMHAMPFHFSRITLNENHVVEPAVVAGHLV